MDTTYILDNYVSVKAGDGFRLFPFGRVYKGGKAHDITPEYAKQIALPHFKAPIKLGSHEDTTPAGGFITSLEVRDDGLYAIPEWNDEGQKAMNNGAFRYNSPEIIWEGGLEDPKTGDVIRAPMIIGTALLHTPHLGNDAALYSVEPIKENKTMENVQVPANLWEKFTAFLDGKLTPPPAEKVEVVPEDYSAIKDELSALKAEKVEREKAEAFNAVKADIAAQLQKKEDYGMSFVELKTADEAAAILGSMDETQREWVMRNFRAFIAQANTAALLDEKGKDGEGLEDPKAQFNALVLKLSAEKHIDYNRAFEIVKAENGDLFASAFAKKEK